MLQTVRKKLFGARTRKLRKSARKPGLSPRQLAVEGLECRQMMSVSSAWFAQNLHNSALCSLARSDFARDGAITRNDMLGIFKLVEQDGKILSAADMHDLKKMLANASGLNMPDYVRALSGDVINDNNPADAHYQGASLANLTVGGSTAVLADLVNKWFLGLDLPSIAGAEIKGTFAPADEYSSASWYSSDPLFSSSGPSCQDLQQGKLGDCYFLSALASIADASPQAVKNMFINNADGTYTVRFFTAKGTADYVTVNTALPLDLNGPYSRGWLGPTSFAYEGLGADNSLWLPLAEKAYAEWDETGNEGRGNVNSYLDIANGQSGNVYNQVLNAYNTSVTAEWGAIAVVVTPGQPSPPQPNQGSEAQLIAALANPANAVTIGTCNQIGDPDSATGLYGDHCYVVRSYDSTTDTFQLYNPWGCDQPNQNLTWSQLQADCHYYAYVNARPALARFPTPPRRAFGSNSGLAFGVSAAPTATKDVATAAGLRALDAALNQNRAWLPAAD
ncbi:MAG: C2 family cysteine protease [Thermoguttaceae bacterium]|jgi:hypothetical protein